MVRSAFIGAIAGMALGVPWLALLYAGARVLGVPFAPFELFDRLVRLLPGPAIAALIETLVRALQTARLGATAELAHTVEAALAVGLTLTGLGVFGAIHGALSWRAESRAPHRSLALGAAMGLTLGLLITQPGAGLLWGLALGWVRREWLALPEAAPVNLARRRWLRRVGVGAAALTILGLGLERWLKRPESETMGVPVAPTPHPLTGFLPVPGTRPEITPIADFYQVDIKLDPPPLDSATWALEVGGLVRRPLKLTYAELIALPTVEFDATLECISNTVGGDLISTTRFSGVPLREVLGRAGLTPEVLDIAFICADGYSESLPVEAALDPGTVLCVAMGGAPLTPEHGYPVRVFTPNRFGMKNPKWITRIEAMSDDYQGFWERRGWREAGWVKTTSVIDAARRNGAVLIEAGGVAYAGARGVQSVEVRVDDGDWVAAELKPALSPLTWVLWRVSLESMPGTHRLTVRATDGNGARQTERKTIPFPEGATGYHHLTVT
ncbi:MAG: molybdopterin-dependent oxidoreductase [Anaerolineales bacterium]